MLITTSVVMSGCLAHRCPVPTSLGNMGQKINSIEDDYGPVLRDTSTLIFTTNRVDPQKSGLREAFSPTRPARLYLSMRLGPEWDEASRYELLPDEEEREIAAVTFPPTPNPLNALAYITSCNGPETDESGCNIYMIPTGEGGPVSPGPGFNGGDWNGHPFATADGARLYFASDCAGGFGGTDIWFVERDGSGLWSAPRNAGREVNTAGDELSPFVDAATGDLYFAASTPGDSLDLFVLRSGASTREALPPPYNSTAGEITPFIRGGKLYFASNREGGCGGYDLYVFPLERE